MKKMMILAAAVVASVAANAAAVNWNSGTISLPSGSQAGKGAVAASLFIVDATTYNTYAAYTDAVALSDAIHTAYGSATATATKSSTAKGAANISYGDYSAGTTVYAVLLYTATESEKDYWMGNYGTVTLASAQDVDVANLANALGGTGASTAWSTAAVPEPTSGLLLLLGMAGLALKRKRA